MSYVSLIGPMIRAAQEQQAEINALWATLGVVVAASLGLFLLSRNRAKSKM